MLRNGVPIITYGTWQLILKYIKKQKCVNTGEILYQTASHWIIRYIKHNYNCASHGTIIPVLN